jgi:hypothetical protein
VCPAVAGGSIVWTAKRPGTLAAYFTIGAVAAAPSGDVLVSDLLLGGGTQLSRIHQFDLVGAYLGTAGGSGGGSGISLPAALATDPLGDVLYAYGTSGVGGYQSLYVTRRPPGGTGVVSIGGAGNTFSPWTMGVLGIGGDSAGRWLVGMHIGAGPSCGATCGFDFGQGLELGDRLLRYDAAGAYLGSIPNPGNWRLAPTGDLYVVAGFQGSADAGCGPVSGGSGPSTLLSKLDQNGACLWSKAFPAPAPAVFTLGGDGSILFGFLHTGSIDLGGGPLPDGGAQNLTIATLDLAGAVTMTRTFGGAGASFSDVVLDTAPSGVVVLSSKFAGAVDLGAGPIGNAGDTLLAAFDPSGSLRWSKVVNVGSAPVNYVPPVLRMTRQPCSMVIATDSPTVDVGAGPVIPVPPPNHAPDLAVIALAL